MPEVVWQDLPDTRLEVPGRPQAKCLRRQTFPHCTEAPSGFRTLEEHLRSAEWHFAPWHTVFL